MLKSVLSPLSYFAVLLSELSLITFSCTALS